MRVVIVGATGNVGTALRAALAAQPGAFDVVGLARRRPEEPGPGGVEWVAADITTDDLVGVFDGADAVVHLAWAIQPGRDEATMRATNVTGSQRVFDAAQRAGVGAVVYASSVGAYSSGPKHEPVGEEWPTDGITGSSYSRHKAYVERLLDIFQRDHPEVRVVRLRPGLIFQRPAASEIRRLFLGPFFPSRLLRPRWLPVVPDVTGLRFQTVHAADVAEAFRLALVEPVRGAFNLVVDPVLDPPALAELLDARLVAIPAPLVRWAIMVTWGLRLQSTAPGWIDLALACPIMSSQRARQALGWEPTRTSQECVLELTSGIRHGEGAPTPPLAPDQTVHTRAHELATGVGARQGTDPNGTGTSLADGP